MNYDYGFTVVFYRHCGEGWGWSGNNEGSQKDTLGDNGTLDGTLSPSEKQQMQIRTMIKQNNKITRKAMAAELGISERSVQRILNSMPDIRFTGGGRSGHWEISDPQE